MNELKVLNNIQGRIEWDSEAAKSYIVSIIAPYRGLVVTDDNVKDMEKTQKEYYLREQICRSRSLNSPACQYQRSLCFLCILNQIPEGILKK